MSMSVCLSVCLSLFRFVLVFLQAYLRNPTPCMHVAAAQTSSGGVAIRYIISVLSLTSCFHIMVLMASCAAAAATLLQRRARANALLRGIGCPVLDDGGRQDQMSPSSRGCNITLFPSALNNLILSLYLKFLFLSFYCAVNILQLCNKYFCTIPLLFIFFAECSYWPVFQLALSSPNVLILCIVLN